MNSRAIVYVRLKRIVWLSVMPFLVSCAQTRTKPDIRVEERIHQTINELPSGGFLRNALLLGWRGDGIRREWMDPMREQGIKAARFEIRGTCYPFVGMLSPQVVREMYFSRYGGPGSQITDSAWLGRVNKAGLGEALRKVAIHRAGKAPWRYSLGLVQHACFAEVYLLDDEWLLTDRVTLAELDPGVSAVDQAAWAGDALDLERLLGQNRFSQKELDQGLFSALAGSWDATGVVRLLIAAGANVNARSTDGSTPLLDASANNEIDVVRILLIAGANPNAVNSSGETALSLAACRRCPDSFRAKKEYSQELVSLLTSYVAHEVPSPD